MEYFMNKRLKTYRLPLFNMLFQFVLTKVFKSKLFSYLQTVDNMINWYKRPIGSNRALSNSITINNITLLFQPLDSNVSIKNCILCTADLRAIRTSSKPSVWTLSRSKINLVSCSSRKINSLSPGERGAKINNDLNNNWKCIKQYYYWMRFLWHPE